MNTTKLIGSIFDYLKGFMEIVSVQTPRYSFIVEKFEITYQSLTMKTKVNYTPVGCYRPFRLMVDGFRIAQLNPVTSLSMIGVAT